MGAVDAYVVFEPQSKKSLIKKYNAAQNNPQFRDLESGTEGYGGTIAQLDRNVKFVMTLMDSEDAAIDYISRNARKREDSIAVPFCKVSKSSLDKEKDIDARMLFQSLISSIPDMDAAIDMNTGEWADTIYDYDTFEEPEMFTIPAPYGEDGRKETHVLEGVMLRGTVRDLQIAINNAAYQANQLKKHNVWDRGAKDKYGWVIGGVAGT